MVLKSWNNGELITPEKFARVGQELQNAYDMNIAYFSKKLGSDPVLPLATSYVKFNEAVNTEGLFPPLKLTVQKPNSLVRLFGSMVVHKTTANEYFILDVLVDGDISATDYRGYDLDPEVNSDGVCLVRTYNRWLHLSWDIMLLGVEEGEHTFELAYRNGGSDTTGAYLRATDYDVSLYVQEYGSLTIIE